MSAESPLFFDDDWRDVLKKLSERIAGNEADSIQARWEFGRVLLQHRVGKQLPNGMLNEVVKTHRISQREVGYRMQFAGKFSTEEAVCSALQTYGTSWRRITTKALPKDPPKPKSRFATLFDRRLRRMMRDATALENLLKDEEFPRRVDELREEWRDDERDNNGHARPGIRFANQLITRAINRALAELTADQGQLFDEGAA